MRKCAKVKDKKDDELKLSKLEEENYDLKRNIKIEKRNVRKSWHIRNLKIFGSTLTLLAPFCIAGTLATTTFYFLGAGLPIVKDEENKYKKYVYECDEDIVNITESYDGGIGFDYNYGKSDFTIFYPWSLVDNKYVRTIKEYRISNLDNVELYDAIINKNIDYIESKCESKKERIEETNDSSVLDNNDLKIEGIVTCVDKENYLSVIETNKKNRFTTVGVGLLTIAAGLFLNRKRRKKVKENIKHYIKEHNKTKEELELTKKRILRNEEKIRSLSKWVNK